MNNTTRNSLNDTFTSYPYGTEPKKKVEIDNGGDSVVKINGVHPTEVKKLVEAANKGYSINTTLYPKKVRVWDLDTGQFEGEYSKGKS